MECIWCSNKPCICAYFGTKEEIENILKTEDLGGVNCKDDKVNYSHGKSGRYWFDETHGWISLKLLKGLILFAKQQENEPLAITRMTLDEAKDFYTERSNGYCIFDKVSRLPKIITGKIALSGELCVDELEAIYNMIYQDNGKN